MEVVKEICPQAAELLRIMSTLYCLSIAADFRKPVEKMYPKIAADYLAVIKQPMDLGTLLLECMRGTATPDYVRHGLHLVFSNSITFNADAPMMKAISLHLMSFAAGLFEEAVKLPFHEEATRPDSVAEIGDDDFTTSLLFKRGRRFDSVCKTPLRREEVGLLLQALHTVEIHDDATKAQISAICRRITEFQTRVDSSEQEDCSRVITLEILLRPLVEAAVVPRNSPTGDEGVTSGRRVPAVASLVGLFMQAGYIKRTMSRKRVDGAPEIEEAATAVSSSNYVDEEKNQASTQPPPPPPVQVAARPPTTTLRKASIPFLFSLDAALGELLVRIDERVLRGTSSSSVWQRPLMLGWATAGGIWFPCMVLACPNANTTSECRLTPGSFYGRAQAQCLADMNVSRMPESIVKQLLKLKSKSCGLAAKKAAAASSAGAGAGAVGHHEPLSEEEQDRLLVVPEGFLLVEFYGTHDFGWVKADSVLPFCVDGSKPSLGRVGSGLEGVRLASLTERWWLRETLEYLPAQERARYIEQVQSERYGQGLCGRRACLQCDGI